MRKEYGNYDDSVDMQRNVDASARNETGSSNKKQMEPHELESDKKVSELESIKASAGAQDA